MPFKLAAAMTVTDVCTYVDYAPSSDLTFNIGLFGADSAGRPGALVATAGAVGPTGNGWKTLSGLSLAVPAGTYWWGIHAKAGTTPRFMCTRSTVASGIGIVASNQAFGDKQNEGYFVLSGAGTGALPATLTGLTVDWVDSGSPQIGVKVS
jgi:hypothetical protein